MPHYAGCDGVVISEYDEVRGPLTTVVVDDVEGGRYVRRVRG